MSVTDELLSSAQRYADDFAHDDLPLPPAKRVAVLACMDARLNPYALLGLTEGDAHVIRKQAESSPTTRFARWRSRSVCSARRRSSSSTTPTAGW